ncbi:MAG: hypothetical protein PVF54_09155 [Anaerolineae bacterium]|jgi:hypothetical protein
MEERLSTSQPVVDFFVHSYRISGRVNVASRKLADQLEDRTTSFLQLEDAYISNIEHPGDIVANHTSAVLRKERIIAAVVTREENGLSRRYTYGSYLGTYMQKAFLVVPAFEIEGHLRLSGKRDPRSVLTSGDLFFPVLDARMRLSARPEVEFTGGVILVNRAQVESLWEEEASGDG